MSAALRLPVVVDDGAAVRPRTRGECQGGERPCPWVTCTEHAIHGVLLGHEGGEITDDAAVELLATMPSTCTLDVADQGDTGTLEVIGDLWGVTRERIRQIEGRALRALPRRVEHLHDALDEDPAPTLRPQGCGPVRPVEAQRRTEAPAQHAHLPGPGDVTEAAQPFWCPWMGAALTGGLCSKRHTARLNSNAYKGVAGGPLYPGCARCEDGAAVARRLGAVGELVPLRVAVPANRIDWMGEGDDPAETDTAPAAMGAEEPIVKVQRKEVPAEARAATSSGVHAPAVGSMCRVPDCTEPPQGYRDALDASLRPLCRSHRQAALKRRCEHSCTSAEALAWVMGERGAGASSTAAPAQVPALDAGELARMKTSLDAAARALEEQNAAAARLREERDLATAALARVREDLERAAAGVQDRDGAFAALRDERDWLLSQRDAARAEAAELRRDRDGLLATKDQRPAVAAPSPWARLSRIVAELRPGLAVTWHLYEGTDGRWGACALGTAEARTPDEWDCAGATPDEAIAALVAVIEGAARARIEALTAAMGGA